MTKAIKILLLLPILLLLANVNTHAQKKKGKKKEEEKVPVYNFVVDDPMDAIGRQPATQNIVNTVLLPEFFGGGTTGGSYGDTTEKQIGYNAQNEIMMTDTLSNYQLLRYVSRVKIYPDPVQKYKDSNGYLQPLPIQKIIFRYDKMSSDKWMYVDYTTNKQSTLKEFPDKIVRTDTVGVSYRKDGHYVMTIFKYYKVTPIK